LSVPWGGLNRRGRKLPAMNKPLLLGAAWAASAGAAVGLGFLAVSLVDASASPVVQPVSYSALESAEATSADTTIAPPAQTAQPVTPGGTDTAIAPPAPPGVAQQVTPGGTVVATCVGDAAVPVLAGAPAAGWWPDDTRQPGTFEFESATQSIEVRATCVGGTPQFVGEGP
jgi:hypothetical protein